MPIILSDLHRAGKGIFYKQKKNIRQTGEFSLAIIEKHDRIILIRTL
jgi:hypothetical protein